MVAFRKSQTAKNLQISFIAETQARTRYNFFATRAAEEGYVQITTLFDETADQEYEHALRFYKFFNGGELETTWSFATGGLNDTYANLMAAADLERYVHDEMYAVFAQQAVEEGLQRAADTWHAINIAEKHHEHLFRHLAENLDNGRVFSRETPQQWKCRGCGYLHTGKSAPDTCPACVRPTGYFELLVTPW